MRAVRLRFAITQRVVEARTDRSRQCRTTTLEWSARPEFRAVLGEKFILRRSAALPAISPVCPRAAQYNFKKLCRGRFHKWDLRQMTGRSHSRKQNDCR